MFEIRIQIGYESRKAKDHQKKKKVKKSGCSLLGGLKASPVA
jgi:hypothetical protein